MRVRSPALPTLLAALAAGALAPASSGVHVPPQDAPAAVLVKVLGEVTIRPREGEPRPAAAGAQLAPGDQLLPAPGAEAVVVHRAGRSQVVREAFTVEAPEESADGDMFTRTVRVFAQAATSDARRVGNRQGMIRPLPGGPAPIAPRNGVRVLDTRPHLTWFAVPGVGGYLVQIRRDGEPPRRFDAGADTVLELPRDVELERGATYHWTVAPHQGRPVLEESFQVLAGADLARLDEAFSTIESLGLDPRGDGGLLASIVYFELGLLYEAAGALASLEAAGGVTADVLLLKGSVLDAMGRFEEARAAFDEADRRLGTPSR